MNRTSAFNYEWLRLNLLFWCLNNKVLDRIYNCFQTLDNRSIRSYLWDEIWFLLHFLSGFLFRDTFRAVGQDEKYESSRNPKSLEIRRWSSSEERLCIKKNLHNSIYGDLLEFLLNVKLPICKMWAETPNRQRLSNSSCSHRATVHPELIRRGKRDCSDTQVSRNLTP